jgi:hypothetical protein
VHTRAARLSCLAFSLVFVAATACRHAAPTTSESQGVGGTLVDLATLGQDNACKAYRNQPFDPNICPDLAAGKGKRGTDTGVCRYFCDSRNNCVSPFASDQSLLAAINKAETLSFSSLYALRASFANGEHVVKFLDATMPWVKSQVALW